MRCRWICVALIISTCGCRAPGRSNSNSSVGTTTTGGTGAMGTAGTSSSSGSGAGGTTGGTSIVVSECSEIATPGTYEVSQNMWGDFAFGAPPCLLIHDVSGVMLDCKRHTVAGATAVQVKDASDVTIQNCDLYAIPPSYTPGYPFYPIDVERVHTFSLQSCSVEGATPQVVDSSNVTIRGNFFTGDYLQSYTVNSTIESNWFQELDPSIRAGYYLIGSAYDTGVTISGNTMSGGADGGVRLGSDDGIILADDSDVVVSGNRVDAVFDCGIEFSGTVSRATVVSNVISRGGACGIGGWYNLSLADVTIADNELDANERALYFFRHSGLRQAGADPLHRRPADTEVDFHDVSFTGNRDLGSAQPSQIPLLDATDPLAYDGSHQSDETVPTPSQFKIYNNHFGSNDFGHALPGPDFGGPAVSGVVVDDGGNTCSAREPDDYPLNCQ